MSFNSKDLDISLEEDFQEFFRSVVLDHVKDNRLNGYKNTFDLESKSLGHSILSLQATTYTKESKRVIDYNLRLAHNLGFPFYYYGTPIVPSIGNYPFISSSISPSISLNQLFREFYNLNNELDFFSSSIDFQMNQAVLRQPYDGKRRVLDLIEKSLDSSASLLLEGSFLSSDSSHDDFYYRIRFIEGCIGKVLNSPLKGPILNNSKFLCSKEAIKIFTSINSSKDFLKLDKDWYNFDYKNYES